MKVESEKRKVVDSLLQISRALLGCHNVWSECSLFRTFFSVIRIKIFWVIVRIRNVKSPDWVRIRTFLFSCILLKIELNKVKDVFKVSLIRTILVSFHRFFKFAPKKHPDSWQLYYYYRSGMPVRDSFQVHKILIPFFQRSTCQSTVAAWRACLVNCVSICSRTPRASLPTTKKSTQIESGSTCAICVANLFVTATILAGRFFNQLVLMFSHLVFYFNSASPFWFKFILKGPTGQIRPAREWY